MHVVWVAGSVDYANAVVTRELLDCCSALITCVHACSHMQAPVPSLVKLLLLNKGEEPPLLHSLLSQALR